MPKHKKSAPKKPVSPEEQAERERLGRALRVLGQVVDINQDAWALRAGIGAPSLSQYLNGNTSAPFVVVMRLLQVIDFTLHDLTLTLEIASLPSTPGPLTAPPPPRPVPNATLAWPVLLAARGVKESQLVKATKIPRSRIRDFFAGDRLTPDEKRRILAELGLEPNHLTGLWALLERLLQSSTNGVIPLAPSQIQPLLEGLVASAKGRQLLENVLGSKH